MKLLDKEIYDKVKIFMQTNNIQLDERGLVANANLCKIISIFINNKLSPFEILTIYDFITDVLQGMHPKIAINVNKEKRIPMAIKILDSKFIPDYKDNLTEDEKEKFAFCIVYSFFTYSFNEESGEMEQEIFKFETFENIAKEYEYEKKEFPFKFKKDISDIGDISKEYGRDKENPIKLKTIDMIYEYLDNICLNNENEDDIKYERTGSFNASFNELIDGFNIYNTNKELIDTLYFFGNASENDIEIPKTLPENASLKGLEVNNYLRVPTGYKIKIRKNMKIDWGYGIPNYSQNDLMSKREILDFAIFAILQYEVSNGNYTCISYNNSLTTFPNIILEKNDKKYAVWVKASVAPIKEKITEYEIIQMKNFINRFNDIIPLFASVGIGSIDSERFDKSIALIGDGYYINYTGLENFKI